VKTPLGEIKIEGGSLVLVLSFAQGLAVYDLDDSHRDAVTVAVNGQTSRLYPGSNLVITTDSVEDFEDINPAQLFAYRHISSSKIGAGLKIFGAEFHVPTALNTVLPLRELTASKHPAARRLTDHLLKATAASLQIHGISEYHQAPRKIKTAWGN
jgi:hypothetical protein